MSEQWKRRMMNLIINRPDSGINTSPNSTRQALPVGSSCNDISLLLNHLNIERLSVALTDPIERITSWLEGIEITGSPVPTNDAPISPWDDIVISLMQYPSPSEDSEILPPTLAPSVSSPDRTAHIERTVPVDRTPSQLMAELRQGSSPEGPMDQATIALAQRLGPIAPLNGPSRRQTQCNLRSSDFGLPNLWWQNPQGNLQANQEQRLCGLCTSKRNNIGLGLESGDTYLFIDTITSSTEPLSVIEITAPAAAAGTTADAEQDVSADAATPQTGVGHYGTNDQSQRKRGRRRRRRRGHGRGRARGGGGFSNQLRQRGFRRNHSDPYRGRREAGNRNSRRSIWRVRRDPVGNC